MEPSPSRLPMPLPDSETSRNAKLTPLGRALFGVGIALLVLRGLDLTRKAPGMPSFWYTDQPLWIACGIGLTALGWQILWRPWRPFSKSWRPSIPGRRFHTATLYVSEGCHLCEEAATLLEVYRTWLPPIEEIDIRSDPSLVERFKTCVPVVVIDGKVRFRGRIYEELLRRLIEGTKPQRW